jgi:hypothetical protein
MPVVRGPISSSTRSGSSVWVAGSMSQKTGRMPSHCSGGDEGEGRYDHLAGQPERADHEFQPDRRIADHDAVAAASMAADPRFEFLDVMAVIGQPAPVQHVLQAGHQSLPVADIGRADAEWPVEAGGAAEEGERSDATPV